MNTPIQRLFLIFCLALLPVSIQAAYYDDISIAGTSAEMMGVSNVLGFSRQASVVLENPAGLATVSNSFSGFYTSFYSDSQFISSAISVGILPDLTVGIGAVYQRYGNLDYTATNNADEFVVTEQFSSDIIQASFGLGYQYSPSLSLGLSLNTYSTSLYDVQGTGADVSIGALITTDMGDWAVSGKNLLGNSVSYNNDGSERLSRTWSVGFRSLPSQFLDSQLYAQVQYLEWLSSYSKNIGIRFYPTRDHSLALSIGYKDKPGINKVSQSIAAGAMLSLDGVSLQYSYDITDSFDTPQQHYFSVAIDY